MPLLDAAGTISALKKLEMSFNELTGRLPEFLDLVSLQTLSLQVNSFTGPLPQEIPPDLNFINFRGNMLDGTIPLAILKNELIRLDLRRNMLTGSLGGLFDDFAVISHLSSTFTYLALDNNYLEGTVCLMILIQCILFILFRD